MLPRHLRLSLGSDGHDAEAARVHYRKCVSEGGLAVWSMSTELAGLRSTARVNRDVGRNREHADSLRIHPPGKPAKRPSTAGGSRTHEKIHGLQVLLAQRRRQVGGTKTAPRRVREPPPLASVLEEAGLGHYRRKLVDDLSCSTVQQLLALTPAALDALIDALRPAPGHRTRILEFIDHQRAKAEAGSLPPPSTVAPEERQRWKADWKPALSSLAFAATVEKRGRGGGLGEQAQPGHWGHSGATGRSPPRREAYVSSVRVLKVGSSRVTVFDGPAPSSPPRGRKVMPTGKTCSSLYEDEDAARWPPSLFESRANRAASARSASATSRGSGSAGVGGGAGGTAGSGGGLVQAPTTNAAGFADNLAGATDVDWAALSAKLPTGTDAASTARRKELWKRADPNGNGFMSSAEVDLMVREVVGEELFSAKPVIQRAFHAARRSGSGEQKGT